MKEKERAADEREMLEKIAANPIHAYKMMKRFTIDWKHIETDIKNEDWEGKMT